jgi:hypothetical protein
MNYLSANHHAPTRQNPAHDVDAGGISLSSSAHLKAVNHGVGFAWTGGLFA